MSFILPARRRRPFVFLALSSVFILAACSKKKDEAAPQDALGNEQPDNSSPPYSGGTTGLPEGGAVGGNSAGGTKGDATGGMENQGTGSSTNVGVGGTGGEAPDMGVGGSKDDEEESGDPLLGSVGFTVPSQTFATSLEVGLNGGEGEIRYTVDGTAPDADSPLWDAASLTLTETTQLRAAQFVNGELQGTPSAAIYILRNFEVTADTPIIIMDGYGTGELDTENKVDWIDLGLMIFEPQDGGLASISALPTLAARAGYHVRGQSSANFAKTPYRVELWGTTDDDADMKVLGMPKESDWAFVGPCMDRTLVRNAFVYDLAADLNLTSMKLRFAEVYINQDGGPLEESDYEGVYAVTQTIKNQKSRLNLKQLEEEDTTLPDIEGGYIFKFDQRAVSAEEGEVKIRCRGSDGEVIDDGAEGCWEDLELVDPAPANAEQTAYIEGHIQQFHDLLHSEPLGDYQSMIDLPSFIDHFIINEMTSDVDAYIRSHFMHKERGGLIKAGPIWDYNFALGSVGAVADGFTYDNTRKGNGTNDWHLIIGPDPSFHEQMAQRYRELRTAVLSDEALFARLDEITAPLVKAATHDNQRWPDGTCSFGGPGFGMPPGGGPPMEPITPPEDEEFVLADAAEAEAAWRAALQDMKDWIAERMAWLDSQWL